MTPGELASWLAEIFSHEFTTSGIIRTDTTGTDALSNAGFVKRSLKELENGNVRKSVMRTAL